MGVWDKIKKKAAEIKQERAYDRAANKRINAKAKAEYYKAKEKEAMTAARGRARIDRERELKNYLKTGGQDRRYSDPFGMMNDMFAMPGSVGSKTRSRTVRKKKKTTRKKKSKGKTITIKL